MNTPKCSPAEIAGRDTRPVRLALIILFLVYAARVAIQLAQKTLGLDAPVPMMAWDSGLVPYPALLAVQVVFGLILIVLIHRVDGVTRPRAGAILLGLGGLYLVVMLARAGIAVLSLSDAPWFDMPVPTSVHIVLAGILIIIGFNLRPVTAGTLRTIMRPLVYPLVMGGALVLFSWTLRSGLAPAVAAYHALVLGAVAIVVAELLMPYRADWLPDRQALRTDAAYLALVQVCLPALASAAVIIAIGRFDLSLVDLWPSELPAAVQVMLMLLIADFGRYWLHRASHGWSMLWRLHAVHHAPEELHALNVGHFHPVEKTIQFAFDTVPFILLGVSDTVVAGYLVFYAVNGFFQHSNVDLRFGVLNYLISGPELHRWHHARDPRLSDHNFGNNLIVWDSLFGTRMLPKDREVADLGLRNPAYPTDLLGQMIAPFTVNPNMESEK